MRVTERKVVRMDKLTLTVEGVWMTTWRDGVERGEETRVRAIVHWAGQEPWSVSYVADEGVLSPYAGSELAKEYGSAMADRHARQFLRWLGLCFKDDASSLFNSLDSAYLFNPEYRLEVITAKEHAVALAPRQVAMTGEAPEEDEPLEEGGA
jgi:hypothetical protein